MTKRPSKLATRSLDVTELVAIRGGDGVAETDPPRDPTGFSTGKRQHKPLLG